MDNTTSCCAASKSVADIVRIAEPVARASTTAGVLNQDDAPQQFTDIAKGSVDSTASVPCRMSHASVPEGLRSITAPPADLVRLSVGLEDLAADLEQALDGTQCESFLQRGERSQLSSAL